MVTAMARELRTERLVLRPWRDDDAPGHRVMWSERDPRVPRRIDSGGRPTVDDLRAGMAARQAAWDADPVPALRLYAVQRLAEGDFIGYCGLVEGQASAEEPELAFELEQRVHGQGYATEAAQAVVAEADATGRTRLWATVREWNAPSFRVLEKVGFHDSGRRTPDPERGDSVWMTRAR